MKIKAPKRARFTRTALLTGVAGVAALGLSVGGSLSGYVATITNTSNTAASASMAIAETSGTFTCNSYDATASCSTINKYGGVATPILPGGSQTVTVKFENTGQVNASTATLTPGTCSATSTGAVGASTPTTPNTTAGNLCSVLNVAVYKAATATGTPIYTGTVAAFTAQVALGNLDKQTSQQYTFVVSLPAGATNAVQGQQVTQSLQWQFNQ